MSLMTKTRLDVRPLASALGAEIFGVDLAGPLDDATGPSALRASNPQPGLT